MIPLLLVSCSTPTVLRGPLMTIRMPHAYIYRAQRDLQSMVLHVNRQVLPFLATQPCVSDCFNAIADLYETLADLSFANVCCYCGKGLVEICLCPKLPIEHRESM